MLEMAELHSYCRKRNTTAAIENLTSRFNTGPECINIYSFLG